MHTKFKEHIEKKIKENKEHNIVCLKIIEVLTEFEKQIEAHKHYKTITNRVLKKFEYDGFYARKPENNYCDLRLFGRVDGEYVEVSFYGIRGDMSPAKVLSEIDCERTRYKNGINNKTYEQEAKILEKIADIVGDNSFVRDIILYGLYNR